MNRLDDSGGKLFRLRCQSGRQIHPIGHTHAHEPRLDRRDLDAGPANRLCSPDRNAVNPGLGRAGDVVRRPTTIISNRAEADHTLLSRRSNRPASGSNGLDGIYAEPGRQDWSASPVPP